MANQNLFTKMSYLSVFLSFMCRYRYRTVTVPLASRYHPVTVGHNVTQRYWSFINLTHRPSTWLIVTSTLPTVHQRYSKLPNVTQRYPPLPIVTHRYSTLLNVTSTWPQCYPPLLNMTWTWPLRYPPLLNVIFGRIIVFTEYSKKFLLTATLAILRSERSVAILKDKCDLISYSDRE